MKKRVSVTIVIIAVILTAGFAFGIFTKEEGLKNSSLRLAKVTRRNIGSSVLATGIIKPRVGAEVKVGSRISGVVSRLYTNIGDQVKKGKLLAELDPVENQARYNQAAATLETAKANLNFARIDRTRQQKLFKKEVVPQGRVDLAETAFDVAQSQFKQAKANLEYAGIQLGYTRIIAPIKGVVASVTTQEGETVSASLASPTFVTIIDLERLEVQAYVDETDIGRIKEGQKALFTVDTFPDTDFEGTVTAIYPKAEVVNNVVNYITIIKIAPQKEDDVMKILRPEMTTSVSILLETRNNVLAVPNKAIRRERGQKYVLLPKGINEPPARRVVKAGWKDRSYTEIVDGLQENQQVVLD